MTVNKQIVGLVAIFIMGLSVIVILDNLSGDNSWWGENGNDNTAQPLMEPSTTENMNNKGTPTFTLEPIRSSPVNGGTN